MDTQIVKFSVAGWDGIFFYIILKNRSKKIVDSYYRIRNLLLYLTPRN